MRFYSKAFPFLLYCLPATRIVGLFLFGLRSAAEYGQKPASLFNNLYKYKIQEYALKVDEESKVHHHFNLLLLRIKG
ncbi:MAG: hypothetical protein KAI06_08635, partial [Anaerolineales bacterium]|nr:hypothetical protein [Anaerolineales bacterium]